MGLKHIFHVIFIWPVLLILRGVGSPFIALGQLLRWLFHPRRSSITSGNTPAYGDDGCTADGDYTNQILSGKVEGYFNQHDRQSNRDNLKCRNRQAPSSQKDELRADTGGLSSVHSDPQISLVPKDLSATFYAISVPPEALEGAENPQLVFRDKDIMLKEIKKYKGARFKLFSKEQVALDYTKSVPEPVTTPVKSTFQNEDTAGNSPHPAMLEKGNWKAPKGADLVILRKSIEAGDFQSVQDMINSNPRFLISCGDTPSILHEGTRYNALHVAAKSNQPKIIRLLIQTIEDPSFFPKLYGQSQDDDDARNVRVQKLLDLYLNTPDKGPCETPLHFACKFGHKEVVEVLMSHPLTEANPKNKFGETPADLICRRVDKPSTQLHNVIKEYLKGRCYVPLYRDENNIVSPTVGTPRSPLFASEVFTPFGVSQTPPFSPEAQISSPKSPCDPQAVVKAFAGPMSPSQADQFRKLWRSPCSRNEQNNVFREDHEKGYERVGRTLALQNNVPWSEYWRFLDKFTDLSKPEGIQLLESYLQKQNFALNVQSSLEAIQQSANNLHNPELSTSASRLQSMKKTFSDICDIENRPEDIDISFGEPLIGISPMTPKTLTQSPKPSSSQMEEMDVSPPFENGTTMPHSQHDSPEQKELSFREENLEEIIDTLSKDFGTKLIINTKSPPDDSPIEDADLKISEKVNTNMNCLFSMKDEFIDMLNAVQNQEPLSVSFMTQASCDKPTYPCLSPALHAPASPQSSTTAGPVLLNIKSPKKLIAQINGMPAKSPPELRKPLKVYIQGSVPTKLDIDVMHCLKNVTVDSEQFPYTAKWLKLVNSFSEIEKKSWTSPAKAHEKKVKTNDGTGTPVMKSRTASRLEPMALFNSPSTDT